MKDVSHRRDDDDRENVTNGDDRKGRRIIVTENVIVAQSHNILAIDSPAPAHDELDTAE